ncbi:heat shock protein [Perkinsela sp. CCAP 1560/4]|nr:heat shock protein [Perkinsela sp. CCAP 1560/4]|eukprot:KNH05486.1 heat shock protein [Perkinsela sp. CCAP 1560/4]
MVLSAPRDTDIKWLLVDEKKEIVVARQFLVYSPNEHYPLGHVCRAIHGWLYLDRTFSGRHHGVQKVIYLQLISCPLHSLFSPSGRLTSSDTLSPSKSTPLWLALSFTSTGIACYSQTLHRISVLRTSDISPEHRSDRFKVNREDFAGRPACLRAEELPETLLSGDIKERKDLFFLA